MPHKDQFLGGVKLPSVTEIVGVIDQPHLRYWYGKNGTAFCERVKKQSADFGRMVHDGIEKCLAESKLVFEDESNVRVNEIIETAWKWVKEVKFKVKELEISLISQRYKFGGTFDAYGLIDGKPVVVDWKTSNHINVTYGLQVAAYAALVNETDPKWASVDGRVTDGIVVRFAKDPEKKPQIEVVKYGDLDSYFKKFLAAKELFHFVKNGGDLNREE